MSYPRKCPLCEVAYIPPFKGADTVESRLGGRGDPVLLGRAGALMYLNCRSCRMQYWWDFFAGAVIDAPLAADDLGNTGLRG